MINSILSAPKTLSRAASGTNLLVGLRPLQLMAGGILTPGDVKSFAKGYHMAFDGFLEALVKRGLWLKTLTIHLCTTKLVLM